MRVVHGPGPGGGPWTGGQCYVYTQQIVKSGIHMYLTRNILNIQGKFVPVLVGFCTNCEQSGVSGKITT